MDLKTVTDRLNAAKARYEAACDARDIQEMTEATLQIAYTNGLLAVLLGKEDPHVEGAIEAFSHAILSIAPYYPPPAPKSRLEPKSHLKLVISN